MLVTPKAETRRSPGTPEAERRTGGEPVRTSSAGHEKITSEYGKTRAEGRQDQRHTGQHGQQPQPRVHRPGFAGRTGHGVAITG
jgi:hypothetical protein